MSSDPVSSGSEKENNVTINNRKRKVPSADGDSDSESEDPEYVPGGKMFKPEGRERNIEDMQSIFD